MCFVHGLANGQYLLDEEFLKPEDAVEAGCTCSHEQQPGGATRRQALGRGALGAGAAIIGSTILGKAAFAPGSARASGPSSGDRIVALGVNGGPVISPVHAQSSTALHVTGKNDITYLIDCGFEAARQMVVAGNLPFRQLRHVFVTHHHSDHTSGYAPLALHSLLGNNGAGPIRRLDFWGPKPISQMQRDFTSMYALDIKSRVESGTANLGKLLHSHQLSLPKRGVRKVMEDGNVVVHATLVKHGADMPGACAYRFTIKKTGRAIVFSGDTAPTKNLIDLAQGAHTLVHECLSIPGTDVLLAGVDPSMRAPLRKHILGTHTDVFEVPAVAKAANVQRLILNHFGPAFFPAARFLADAKTGAARAGFAGEILAAQELDSFAV
jgi:ribonuclease BN (tRNA processing enzyme)